MFLLLLLSRTVLHLRLETEVFEKEMVYNYLTGQTFRQRIEVDVELVEMPWLNPSTTCRMIWRRALSLSKCGKARHASINSATMEKIWARRQQQIERIVKNTTRFYGDLQGIIGAALPPIARLELPAGEEDEKKRS